MPASAAPPIGTLHGLKSVIAHADDIGMCHGANAAFRALAGKGFITCGSVMVPCPWFREIAEIAAGDPGLDLGVHLTLTSEWRYYRWRPITGNDRRTGLVDDHGFMWGTARAAREHADPAAVESELRAQIDLALASGIDVTHLDCHMGTALAAEFTDIYLRLGRDYRVPVLFPRDWSNYDEYLDLGDIDPSTHRRRVADLETNGHPVVDVFVETPWTVSADDDAPYFRMLDAVRPGLTFLAFHPNASGDIEVIDPPRAHCRPHELRLFQTPDFLDAVRRNGLQLTGFREVRDHMRAHKAL